MAAEKSILYFLFFICGNMIEDIAAVSADPDPEIAARPVPATTAT